MDAAHNLTPEDLPQTSAQAGLPADSQAQPQARPQTVSSERWFSRLNPLGWSPQWIKRSAFALAGVLMLELLWVGIKLALPALLLSRMAVVDVDSVLQERRDQFVTMLSRPGVTDDDRDKAYEFVKQTSSQVRTALDQVISDCHCLVFVKSAVYNPDAVQDLTPSLKSHMQQGLRHD